MKESAPWFIWPLLESVGVLFVVMGIPLARRRVPPNGVYGIRFPTTLANESIWYDINARGGRHLIGIGIAYLVLLNGLLLMPGVDDITTIVAALVFHVGALLVDVVVLYRAASRLAGHSTGERSTH